MVLDQRFSYSKVARQWDLLETGLLCRVEKLQFKSDGRFAKSEALTD